MRAPERRGSGRRSELHVVAVQALIRLRRHSDLLSVGAFRLVAAAESVLAYAREAQDQHLLIALNMTHREQVLRTERPTREALLSTYLDRPAQSDADEIHLRAHEGVVLSTLPAVPNRGPIVAVSRRGVEYDIAHQPGAGQRRRPRRVTRLCS